MRNFVVPLVLSLILYIEVQCKIRDRSFWDRVDHFEPHPNYGKYEDRYSFKKPWLTGIVMNWLYNLIIRQWHKCQRQVGNWRLYINL